MMCSPDASLGATALAFAEAQHASSHADQIAGTERRGLSDAESVDIGSAAAAAIDEQIAAAMQQDTCVTPFDTGVAKQADVAGFGSTDECLALTQQHLAASTKASIDADPGFAQHHLSKGDHQANTDAEHY